MRKSTAGSSRSSYGAFLETLREAIEAEPYHQQLPKDLLLVLEAQQGPMKMRKLAGTINTPIILLVKTIEQLKQQEILTITPTDDDELVELTPTGHRIARLEQSQRP